MQMFNAVCIALVVARLIYKIQQDHNNDQEQAENE